MSKSKNLKQNTSQNFILIGLNSIQVGLYILLGAYLLKKILAGFVSGELPIGMMSIEIIEVLGLSIVILVFLFSTLAIFFSGRRQARKYQYKLWSKKTKKYFLIYFILIIGGAILLKSIANSGNISMLVPVFLIYYAVSLAILNSKKIKTLYLISGLGLLLSFIVYIIPTYWYSALLIIGTSHIVYGLIHRK